MSLDLGLGELGLSFGHLTKAGPHQALHGTASGVHYFPFCCPGRALFPGFCALFSNVFFIFGERDDPRENKVHYFIQKKKKKKKKISRTFL
jgi:hypothetical protein